MPIWPAFRGASGSGEYDNPRDPIAPLDGITFAEPASVHPKLVSTVLLIWCGLNALPGTGSLLFILLGHHAPAFRMLFSADEVSALDSRVLATTDGIAIIANTLIVVFCATAFVVIRRCLLGKQTWSFVVLSSGAAALQVAGYVSDGFFRRQNTWVLRSSTAVLVIGFALSGCGLFRGTPLLGTTR